MTTKTIGSREDQPAVLDVLKRLYEAREANDAEAFVADYLDDASVVQPGVYKKDHQEIQSTMAGGFAGPLKGSHVIDQPQDVRFVNEETAIVISEGRIVFPGQNAAEPGHGPGHLGAGHARRPLVCRGVPQQRRELGIGVRVGFPSLWEADSYRGAGRMVS
jgi:uncharacterized protein (TIGR02246 family)